MSSNLNWNVTYYRECKERAWADVQRHRAQPGYDTMLATHEGAVLWAKFQEASASLLGAEIDKHAWAIRDRNTKALGKMYGKASRMIQELRLQLRWEQSVWRKAIRECNCGAWRRVRADTEFPELAAMHNEVETIKSYRSASRDAYRRLLKERDDWRNKALGELP